MKFTTPTSADTTPLKEEQTNPMLRFPLVQKLLSKFRLRTHVQTRVADITAILPPKVEPPMKISREERIENALKIIEEKFGEDAKNVIQQLVTMESNASFSDIGEKVKIIFEFFYRLPQEMRDDLFSFAVGTSTPESIIRHLIHTAARDQLSGFGQYSDAAGQYHPGSLPEPNQSLSSRDILVRIFPRTKEQDPYLTLHSIGKKETHAISEEELVDIRHTFVSALYVFLDKIEREELKKGRICKGMMPADFVKAPLNRQLKVIFSILRHDFGQEVYDKVLSELKLNGYSGYIPVLPPLTED